MRVPVALALAFLCGGGVSLQAFVNGLLGTTLGSAEMAAVVSNAVGLLALLVLGFGSGALARAWRRVRAGGPGRAWHYAGSAVGSLFVMVAAIAAPKVGIALLTVALVCGQTVGSLVADAFGISPARRRALTVPRVLGVLIALVAVGIGALGAEANLDLGILAVAVGAGVGLAVGQAALGQLTETTGEPLAAANAGFALGAVFTVVAAALLGGLSSPNGWSAPSEQWVIGGLAGAAVVVALGPLVIALGVLRLTLALVAGQSVGALVLDVAAPAAGRDITVRIVAGVALTFVAVVVSGSTRRALPPSAPVAPRGSP